MRNSSSFCIQRAKHEIHQDVGFRRRSGKAADGGQRACCGNVDELKEVLESIGYYRLSAYRFPYKTVSDSGKTVFRDRDDIRRGNAGL